MDYDTEAPFDLARYRELQRSIPGVDGLYRLVCAVLTAETAAERLEGRLDGLLAGAGGGREIEALAPIRALRFTVVDPSRRMIAAAAAAAAAARCDALERTEFVTGLLAECRTAPAFDFATALLVMHFLPDDGEKLDFLTQIRRRLRPGAVYLHADVCCDGPSAMARVAPVFRAHALSAGLSVADAEMGIATIGGLPVVGAARLEALFAIAGFTAIEPIFQGLWYRCWRMRAGVGPAC